MNGEIEYAVFYHKNNNVESFLQETKSSWVKTFLLRLQNKHM